jgi:Domain of unknown function (DUF1844)
MSDRPADAPKIIIDEDWKSRVEREKEDLASRPATPPPTEATAPRPASNSVPEGRYLPATLSVLVSLLASQAEMALVGAAQPDAKTPQSYLAEARHLIDLLEMLEDKTQGNRTADETRLLTSVLAHMRIAYVEVSGAVASSKAGPPAQA